MSEYQPQKHTNYDYKDILDYLKKVKISIVQENYKISMNRKKNKQFIEDYRIDSKKIKNIIFNLKVEDFCYAVDNKKEEYSHEVLYVFCPQRELNYFGVYKEIDIYIKFNLINNDNYLYIISFHELEKRISFLFE